MFIEPLQLIDQTIDQLQTLAAHFEDETSERIANAAPLTPEARRFKEALLTINVLIPKLRAAKLAQVMSKDGQWCARKDVQDAARYTRPYRTCLNCED